MRSRMRFVLGLLLLAGTLATGARTSRAETPDAQDWLGHDIRQLLRMQDEMRADGREQDAKALFQRLRKANPDNLVAKFLAARLFNTAPSRKTMEKALQQRLGLPVARSQEVGAAWLALARAQVDAAKWGDALVSARHAATLTHSATAQALVAWLARRSGDKKLAITAYTATLRASPRHMPSRHALAMLLLQEQKTADALKLVQGTLLLAPRDPKAHLHWGMALSAAGRVEDARNAYAVALQLSAGDPDGLSTIAAALRRIEHAKLAEDALVNALRSSPDHFGLLVNLAIIAMDREDNEGAIALLKRARKKHPGQASTSFLLGLAYHRSKNYRKAIQVLHTAVKEDPTQPSYRLALGEAYREAELPDNAVRIIREAVRKFPDHERLRHTYARALFDRKKYRESAKEYAAIIERHPDELAPRFLLAIVYGAHLGEPRRAHSLLEEYASMGGSEPAALEWLKKLRKHVDPKGGQN